MRTFFEYLLHRRKILAEGMQEQHAFWRGDSIAASGKAQRRKHNLPG